MYCELLISQLYPFGYKSYALINHYDFAFGHVVRCTYKYDFAFGCTYKYDFAFGYVILCNHSPSFKKNSLNNSALFFPINSSKASSGAAFISLRVLYFFLSNTKLCSPIPGI